MKYTRKLLGGFVTYDENDSFVHANSFLGYIFKTIWSLICGTVLGVIMVFIIAFIAYIGLYAIVWIGELIFQ